MAAISPSIFISPGLTFHSNPSISTSSSVKYKRVPITQKQTVRSMRDTCSSSLYEVLGVRVGADAPEVKSAYRKLARVLHPDVGTYDSSADEFMKLHSAYVTLMDPEKRADYDRTFLHMRTTTTMIATGGYRCRRWETDQCW